MGKSTSIVVHLLSNVSKSLAFEWIAENFADSEIELQFILLNQTSSTPLSEALSNQGIRVHFVYYSGKKNLPAAWLKVYFLLLKIKPMAVHTHLFEASLVGLTTALLSGVSKRIVTRHHSTYHHEYFPHAVKYDKLINFFATKIVAISQNVYDVLVKRENVPPSKVSLIEHGFKLSSFKSVDEKKSLLLKVKHQIPEGKIVIATIARYFELKGIEYTIRAFKRLAKKHSNLHLLLANARGIYKKEIHQELHQLEKGSYTEIEFEEDLVSLYSVIDYHVHVPINSNIEAFGQTYVEALASKTPSIFTLSGIAKDFVKDGYNALVVQPKIESEIYEAMDRYLSDETLRNTIAKNGIDSVQRFDIKFMTDKLKGIYIQ